MFFMSVWFLSGIIFIIACIPLIIHIASQPDDKPDIEKITPSHMFLVFLVWAFIGALFIREYGAGFWYVSSLFIMTALMSLFKEKSHDEMPKGTMPMAIWTIMGLIIPFITG